MNNFVSIESEATVDLRIRHFKDGGSTDEYWSSTLEHAKDIVCRWVREGTVDRVEIRSANHELVFRYPQMTAKV